MTYTMTVNTTPIPKGRPRFYGNHAVTPPKTREYEKLLRESWTHGILKSDRLMVSMSFTFEIPKSYTKKKRNELMFGPKTSKPDLDNLVKAVLDSLNGVAYEDDSIIWSIDATKEYGDEPEVAVTFYAKEDDDG